jgi:hypothetical protein
MVVIGPKRAGQVLGDGIEDVLVARPENDVRAHAGRRLGDPADGERGVPLAATERLPAGQVPLPVVLCAPGHGVDVRGIHDRAHIPTLSDDLAAPHAVGRPDHPIAGGKGGLPSRGTGRAGDFPAGRLRRAVRPW